MPDATADRNLLFGVLTLQMDFISRDELIAAMNAWVLDKGRPLGQVLIDRGALNAADRAWLEAGVERHLARHGNDPQQSLAALSSGNPLGPDLRPISDTDLQTSLAQPSGPAPARDPNATGADRASPAGRRFLILRPHARGGLGEVFVARDEELRREVALKEMQERHAHNPDSRARFLLEAEVTGGLEHPGVVPVYGLGTYADGRPFYAMRLIRGESLKDAIDRFHREKAALAGGERTLRLRQLLGRFVYVCQAVAYAHSRGVLHRDLKPANILLGQYGETLVVDWGLAKVLGRAEADTAEGPLRPSLSGDATITQTGAALGTPAFMSPEQAAGRLDQLGPASDVYSLGATLYCLLTGRPPFAEGAVGAVLARVQRGDCPRPRELDRRVHPALEAICRRAMALRPGDRYASPLALADDLERWLADEPVSAYREPAAARLARWGRRHRTLVAVAAFVLLTLAGAAVVGGLVVGREQERARALAQAEALPDAAAGGVPVLLQDLQAHPADVRPRLRALWQEHALNDGRRLRVGLALADDAEVRARLVALARTADDPQEVLLVRDALLPHAAAARPLLWEQVQDGATPAGERFRLLAILATLDPDDGRWAGLAADVVSALIGENVLRVSRWAEALRPVRGPLLPALSAVFRDAHRPETERGLALGLLTDYAADRPEVLADLLMEADAKSYAALWPLLERHRDQAAGVLSAELDREPAPDWEDAAPQPGWAAPDETLVRQVEAAQGLVAERFALVQALPLAPFDALAQGLRRCGYRPLRYRPHAAGDGVRVAAVWTRDGRECRWADGLTAEEVRGRDAACRKEGFRSADVAGYLDDNQDRYAALWVRAEPGEDVRLCAGEGGREHNAATFPTLRDAGLVPLTRHVLVLANGETRHSSIWSKGPSVWGYYWRQSGSAFEAHSLAQLPLDVSVSPRRDWADHVRQEVLTWLGRPLPWGALALQSYDAAGPRDADYAGAWQARTDREGVCLLSLDAAAHLARCRELAARGDRPVALSVACAPAGEGRFPEGMATSIWHRPVVPEAAKERLANRQASAAVALLRLGHGERVWPLLQHRPDPRVRSYLIHRLSPLGADARAVVKRLAEEPDVSARRALLLCLGEFSPDQLPAAERQALGPSLLRLYLYDPDPGTHAAVEWLLRQWHQAADLAPIDRELATGRVEGQRRWYVNGQGQTFVVVPGPAEFVMGSPRTEDEREGGPLGRWETPHRQRIGRTFAIATKEVTLDQFRRFGRPSTMEVISPTPEHPVNGVTWYAAAAYCNWLSQQEGIPEDQWCYLPNARGQFADGMRMRPDYLRLTGYRLPTEAEWEYACRAGTVTSRYYGETEELLDRYARYAGNSDSREMLRPGSLKPNDLGLFDMLGNAREWCQGHISPYPAGRQGEPLSDSDLAGSDTIEDRVSYVLRGGAFGARAGQVRSASRGRNAPLLRSGSHGFRPARTMP
jgi:formylglycine-generating enzyme required for sulfatase activity